MPYFPLLKPLPQPHRLNQRGENGQEVAEPFSSLFSHPCCPVYEERNNPYDGLTADQLKTHGNQKMANGYYQEAVTCYTNAIEMDDTSAIYYANRASAYTHLKQYSKAIVDCETALKLDADRGCAEKGYCSSSL